jgi:CheY-like chemotaxis protein
VPEVIFCDIGLPGMDGHAVAQAIRADPAFEKVFLVALSGYALPEDVERALGAGFHQHLAKPPSLEVIGKLLVAHGPSGGSTSA